MADFYYRETGAGSHRPMGPYETADEARKAARYKGLLSVEVIRRSGTGFELVAGAAGPAKSGPAAGTGGRTA